MRAVRSARAVDLGVDAALSRFALSTSAPTLPTVGDSTISVADRSSDATSRDATSLGLVIAWSKHQPERVGEIALFPAGGGVRTLGRGAGGVSSVVFGRLRPGGFEDGAPLEGPGISRRQLSLRVRGGVLLVERVGRCPILVGGEPVERTALEPGDTLLLRGQLLLLCVSRPVAARGDGGFPMQRAAAFGRADDLGIVGESDAAWLLRGRLAFAAHARGHVLVTGPTGAGKELAARAVHALSSRNAGPFIARNAATFPGELVDAELFGTMKGYPNPGLPERRGLVGEADGGTLLLDEIGDLPAPAQAHLLRFLDRDGEYQRLGESRTRTSDVRVVAATSRPLEVLREDLAQRFRLRLTLPSLAERREDIPLLLASLLAAAARESPALLARFRDAEGRIRVDPALVEHALHHPLEGNVRELESLVWSAIEESRGDQVELPAAALAAPRRDPSITAVMVEPTADAVRDAVRAADGNLSEAARALGLPSRYSFYRLLKRLGLEVRDLRV